MSSILRRKFFTLLLLPCILSGCYTFKNQNHNIRINIQTFKNDSRIFGLENDLASFLPVALRREANFKTSNNELGYILKGKIISYTKKVIRKATNGDPTHQQVTIEALMEFYENEKLLYTQKMTNQDYRIDSGLYNITIGETESSARSQALADLSGGIATRVNYYFLGK